MATRKKQTPKSSGNKAKATKRPTKGKAASKSTAKMRPIVSAFIADDARKNRKDTSAVAIRKGSQAEAAVKILAASSDPLTHAEIVAACKSKRVTVAWPIGLMRNLEKRGLVQKFRGESNRVTFALTAKGKATAASL